MTRQLAVNLDMFSKTPLYQQLAAEMEGLIRGGRLANEQKLPSIRELSKQLQLSTVTVRQAIEKLAAEGLVIGRHGAGNFVSAGFSQRVEAAIPRFTIGS